MTTPILKAPALTADDEPAKVLAVRYQCPYCPYRRASKKLVKEHVGRCWHRPANRSCRTCIHRVHQWPVRDWETGYDEPGVEECALGVGLPPHPTDPGSVVPASNCPSHELRDEYRP